MPLLELLRIAVALLLGYAAGSLPVAAWIGRAAGADQRGTTEPDPEAADIWRLAGPGPGLLALTGDLAKGVVPVAVAIVTLGWWTGWVVAVGVVAGAAWPALGRRLGGPGIATLAGACLPLAPMAGLVGLAVGGGVAAVGRLAGRDARRPAVVAGFAAGLASAVVELADAARLSGLVLLLLGTALWIASTRRARPDPAPGPG